MTVRAPDPPVEEDLMKLARFGEIGLMQKLFDSGKADANTKDETGVTPLHVCLHSVQPYPLLIYRSGLPLRATMLCVIT